MPRSLHVPTYAFSRKSLSPNEVLIDIMYCSVCHSDVHQVRNDCHNTLYPEAISWTDLRRFYGRALEEPL